MSFSEFGVYVAIVAFVALVADFKSFNVFRSKTKPISINHWKKSLSYDDKALSKYDIRNA